MLYLEDFLELIEHLPSELRDRFTEMREKDLEVQNSSDKNDEAVQMFFRNALNLSPEERERQTDIIRKNCGKTLEIADEKVSLATNMHELLERFLKKLDCELGKFKNELESDNPGITEMLEKKVLEAEEASNITKRERRKRQHCADSSTTSTDGDSPTSGGAAATVNAGPAAAINAILAKPELAKVELNSDHSATTAGLCSSQIRRGSLSQLQQQQQQQVNAEESGSAGLSRTAHSQSVSAGLNLRGNDFISPSLSTKNINSSFLHSFQIGPDSRLGRPRKLTSKVGDMLRDEALRKEQREAMASQQSTTSTTSMASQQQLSTRPPSSSGGRSSNDVRSPGSQSLPSTDDEQNDPNEPRYCICNQVSYGEMVACDNKDCPFEWFHYACVGITQPPRGKWYCPQCTAAMRRRAVRFGGSGLQNSTING